MPKKINASFFIEKFKEIHEDKYDYSKSNIVKSHEKIIIICPKHGEFLQAPIVHVKNHGCPECGLEERSKKRTSERDVFIDKSKSIHGSKYDYSKVVYKKAIDKVSIICPMHGEFLQSPNSHLRNHGCPECSNVKVPTEESFINKSREIHGNDKYDYSKVNYINAKTKVEIICPKHGSFTSTPDNHLRGKCGCPRCRSSKGELVISLFLKRNKINFIDQKVFENCKYKYKLKFDFYLPDNNICVEYDGLQHYKPWVFNDEIKAYNKLEIQKEKDTIKDQYCKDSNIKLIRIPY